jgi:ectoine hydroxylase-related dioxygenase (phytanoyl-CoA dioxygenase family)
MEPPTQITVSIALTDATIENGCFQVIPGSHKLELQDWGVIQRDDNTLTDRNDVDLSALIQVPLRAGSAIFFDSKLVHGSGANTTPNPRTTALYAYFPPNVRYCPPEGDGSHEKTCPVIRGCGGQSEVVFTSQ